MGVHVVRAFVGLREMIASHKELALKLDELERKLATHDQAIAGLIDAIRQLMAAPETKKRPIGFVAPQEKKRSSWAHQVMDLVASGHAVEDGRVEAQARVDRAAEGGAADRGACQRRARRADPVADRRRREAGCHRRSPCGVLGLVQRAGCLLRGLATELCGSERAERRARDHSPAVRHRSRAVRGEESTARQDAGRCDRLRGPSSPSAGSTATPRPQAASICHLITPDPMALRPHDPTHASKESSPPLTLQIIRFALWIALPCNYTLEYQAPMSAPHAKETGILIVLPAKL